MIHFQCGCSELIRQFIINHTCRSTDESNMQVSEKDINVYGENCLSDICQENCLKMVCIFKVTSQGPEFSPRHFCVRGCCFTGDVVATFNGFLAELQTRISRCCRFFLFLITSKYPSTEHQKDNISCIPYSVLGSF